MELRSGRQCVIFEAKFSNAGERESRGNSRKGDSILRRPSYEKLPCGPSNRMSLGEHRYSMKVGDNRFGCVTGTPGSVSTSPALFLL